MNARRLGQLVLDLFGVHPSEMFEPSPVPRTERERPAGNTDLAWPGLPAGVEVVLQARLRRSWRLERPRGAPPRLLVPAVLAHAPEAMRAGVAAWAAAVLQGGRGAAARRREASREPLAWLSREHPQTVPPARSVGCRFDLQMLFDELNRRHFDGRLRAVVRWSPRRGGLSTHRQVEAREGNVHLVTLSRAYDGDDVPRHAVEGVLYHEMLHIAFPPREGGSGRRQVHHREFREAERAFPGYAAWREWEAREMPRRVRALRGGLRRRRR